MLFYSPVMLAPYTAFEKLQSWFPTSLEDTRTELSGTLCSIMYRNPSSTELHVWQQLTSFIGSSILSSFATTQCCPSNDPTALMAQLREVSKISLYNYQVCVGFGPWRIQIFHLCDCSHHYFVLQCKLSTEWNECNHSTFSRN